MNFVKLDPYYFNLDRISYVKIRENKGCTVFFGKEEMVSLTGEEADAFLGFIRKSAKDARADTSSGSSFEEVG